MLHFMSFFSNETEISDRYFLSALDKKIIDVTDGLQIMKYV